MKESQILKLFTKRTPYLRMRDFQSEHVNTREIAKLVSAGILEKIKPGLYRRSDLQDKSAPRSFFDVSAAVPKGIICLVSALSYYELTTQNPGKIYCAIPNSLKPPKISFPPVKFFFFRESWYSIGIEIKKFGFEQFKIYSIEKSICDVFHLRNKIGEDIALESLKNYLTQRKGSPAKLLNMADQCGVRNVLMPYLKAMVI